MILININSKFAIENFLKIGFDLGILGNCFQTCPLLKNEIDLPSTYINLEFGTVEILLNKKDDVVDYEILKAEIFLKKQGK